MPLNEHGFAQARALASSFARRPAAIYASPLLRAQQTAQMIGAASLVDVRTLPDLIEMDLGEMAHLSRAELRERYPEFARRWRSDDAADARVPGGETLREVQARAWRAVERLRLAHPTDEVVAVTHDFLIRTIVCRVLDLPLSRLRRLRQDLATKTVIELSDGGATLLGFSDGAHLAALRPSTSGQPMDAATAVS